MEVAEAHSQQVRSLGVPAPHTAPWLEVWVQGRKSGVVWSWVQVVFAQGPAAA